MKRIAFLLIGLVLVCLVIVGATAALTKIPKHLEGIARIVYADSVLRKEAATAIIPYVTGVADRDPATHAWRYTYTLTNDPASDNAIRFFGISPVPGPPLSLPSPTHWMGTRGFDADTDAVVWGVVDAQEPPANWDSVSSYPSVYDLQPGDSVTFSFVHTLAPVMVAYYVQGFFYPDTNAELENAPDPNVFQSSITGSVVGPGSTVGVGEKMPEGQAQLRAPSPNPTKGRVSIAFYLPTRAPTRVTIHDVAGRRVRTLVDGVFDAGYHSAEWDGRDEKGVRVRAGVYFYQLFVNGNSVGDRRVTILR